jgi:hypothetical protein
LTGDNQARLRCFDDWAARQVSGQALPAAATTPTAPRAPAPLVIAQVTPAVHDCKSHQFVVDQL